MGRVTSFRKGSWTEEEDQLLRRCVEMYGEGKWRHIPARAGLNRCRKSCRLRWLNYLHPNIKRGDFAIDEVDLIIRLHRLLGNRWTLIAGRIPGRTANDVKNYWNSHLSKKLLTSEHKIISNFTHNLHDPVTPAMNSGWSPKGTSESSSGFQQPRVEEEEDDENEEEEEEEKEATSSFWKSLLVEGEDQMETNSTKLTVEKKVVVGEDDDFSLGVDELLQDMDMELWGGFGGK